MIRAEIRVGNDGLLLSVDVTGHADFGVKGNDIVCASVTTMVRSAARLLEITDGFVCEGDTPQPGVLSFSVVKSEPGSEEYLRAVGDILILGLSDIASEYPKRCSVRVIQGVRDGT